MPLNIPRTLLFSFFFRKKMHIANAFQFSCFFKSLNDVFMTTTWPAGILNCITTNLNANQVGIEIVAQLYKSQ